MSIYSVFSPTNLAIARTVAAFTLVGFAACSENNPNAPSAAKVLPPNSHLLAQASGSDAGFAVTCSLDFITTLARSGNSYRGTMGGEIKRKALRPDGPGLQFFGDAYYEDLRVTFGANNRVTMTAYRNGAILPPDGTSRFWDAILTFEGTYDEATQSVSGSWVCRPFDAHDDNAGEATGTWTLSPAQ